MLIVMEYDFSLIQQKIERYLIGCTGEDWQAVARKLSIMGSWEFEDYQIYSENKRRIVHDPRFAL